MPPIVFLFVGPLFSLLAYALYPFEDSLPLYDDAGFWLVLAFILFFYLKHPAPLSSPPFPARLSVYTLLFRLAVVLSVGFALSAFFLWAFKFRSPTDFWELLFSGEYIPLAATLTFWLARAYLEEFLFRYIPYQLAGAKGLLFSVPSFVFVHIVNPWHGIRLDPGTVLNYVVITLFLSWTFLYLRSVYWVSAVHALLNAGFFLPFFDTPLNIPLATSGRSHAASCLNTSWHTDSWGVLN